MRTGIAVMIFAFLVGCGRPPELPPKESMTVDFQSIQASGAIVDPAAKTHWTQAAVRVGLLNLWVGLGLAPHVGVFHGAYSQRPRAEDDRWVWSYTVKDANVDATATLSARMDGNASVWEMRVNGRVGAQTLSNFLWYDGRYEVSSGYWQIYNYPNGNLVRIDWKVNSPTDKELRFTNNAGGIDNGDYLVYKRSGDTANVFYDFQQNQQADIAWSISTKAGYIQAADYVDHENVKACWDTNLFDTVCPQ